MRLSEDVSQDAEEKCRATQYINKYKVGPRDILLRRIHVSQVEDFDCGGYPGDKGEGVIPESCTDPQVHQIYEHMGYPAGRTLVAGHKLYKARRCKRRVPDYQIIDCSAQGYEQCQKDRVLCRFGHLVPPFVTYEDYIAKSHYRGYKTLLTFLNLLFVFFLM